MVDSDQSIEPTNQTEEVVTEEQVAPVESADEIEESIATKETECLVETIQVLEEASCDIEITQKVDIDLEVAGNEIVTESEESFEELIIPAPSDEPIGMLSIVL